MPGAPDAQSAINKVLGQGGEEEETGAPEASFALEYQLRDFIAQNLNSIAVQGKHLQLYVDPTGRDGVEFPSAVRPIDILAVDDSGAFVVFELKRARSPDQAIGQLTRYMAWVKQTVGRGRQVCGVIVAKAIGDNLRYAASVIPGITLFEYEVELHLRPAHELAPGITSDSAGL
jgi:hypothetical protein